MTMRISWDDLDRPDHAGSYPFAEGLVNVRRREVEIWKKHPDAVFLATRFEPAAGRVQYALSTFELSGGELGSGREGSADYQQTLAAARTAIIDARRDLARQMARPGADVKLWARHFADLQAALTAMEAAIRHEKELAARGRGAGNGHEAS
jgi:hypothetical protein